MLDMKTGWVEAGELFRHRVKILRTTDGAATWTDVTPRPFPHEAWDCQFPKPDMAWISFCETNTFLVLTTNAGKFWMPWRPLGSFDNSMHNFFLGTEKSSCHFFNERDGQAIDVDLGTCHAVYDFFETHDGGLTWARTAFSPIEIGDCDGSSISYYPPRKIVIVQGDLMDETAKGILRFSVSADAGKTWRDLAFPLPRQYQDRMVESSSPHFFDGDNALVPVYLTQETARGFVDPVLVLYSTSDGGNTWRTAGGTLRLAGAIYEHSFDYVSPKDVFIQAGADLYATHDGGSTWHTIRPDINVPDVVQMNFQDAKHGWAVVRTITPVNDRNDYSFTIFRTTNGGKTWRVVRK